MQGLEIIAAKQKFRKIQKLNSQLFKLVHELSEEEWEMFLGSEYMFPLELPNNKTKVTEESKRR